MYRPSKSTRFQDLNNVRYHVFTEDTKFSYTFQIKKRGMEKEDDQHLAAKVGESGTPLSVV